MSDSSNHSKQVVSINDETEVKSGVIITADAQLKIYDFVENGPEDILNMS